MRKLILFLMIFSTFALYGQDYSYGVVKNVDTELVGGNKIQISYYLDPIETDAQYTITASVILDSGEELELESVTGDVGGGISGRGRKIINWDVFDQLDYFQGEELVFIVTAEQETSIGEALGGAVVKTGEGIWYMFAGSEETQNYVNGIILFGGYPMQSFNNDQFKDNKDNGVLSLKQAWSAGFRYQVLPLIFTFDYSQSKFDLNLDLPMGEEIYARHENISGELNITFLPILKQIIPSAGAGYQYGILHTGDYKNWVETSGVYIDGMIELNLGAFSFAATYRKSISAKNERGWNQILLSAGINFGGGGSSESTTY